MAVTDAPAGYRVLTVSRNGQPIRVQMPRAYRFDPGPQATMTFHTGPTAYPRRDDCPRCGTPVTQEPAFMHCAMCGRYFPVAGASLNAQRDFELFDAYGQDRPGL